MPDIAMVPSNLLEALGLILLVVKGFALVDCIVRPTAEFSYQATLPKQTWMIILVLAFLGALLFRSAIDLLNLVGTVAALVYLAQLRGSAR